MDKTGSSVGGASGPSSQEWIPAKIYVTPQDLAEIWDRQGGKCYWFNIPLDITLLYKDHKDWMPKHPLAPSIDKIDVSGDYTKDNIVICTRFANFGRNVCDFDRFHEIVKVLKGTEQLVGYGYDELKDFDMGYKGRKNRTNITPFLGENR